MSIEKENDNIVPFKRKKEVTVEVKPHPSEIIDVDPTILERMKARLSGEKFEDFFDKSDQHFPLKYIEKEKRKLQYVFSKREDLSEGFSSIGSFKKMKTAISGSGVDLAFLKRYALVISGGQAVDPFDFYNYFLFDGKLLSKVERLDLVSWTSNKLLNTIKEEYKLQPFQPLNISRESRELSEFIQALFRSGLIKKEFNHLLELFYGGSNGGA